MSVGKYDILGRLSVIESYMNLSLRTYDFETANNLCRKRRFMAKKQSKYERPGGAKKGRIAVVIFIIVAAITDAIMIRAYFTGGKSAMVGAMIILMTAMYVFIAYSLIKLVKMMEEQMVKDAEAEKEAEEKAKHLGKGAAYKTLKKKSKN